MNFTRKPGSDSGIDRGIVAIFLLWIAIMIALVILLVVRAHGEGKVPRSIVHRTQEFCKRKSI
jgi:hypothetical protein